MPYPTDPDAPTDPHQSLISIRSNDVIIRGNIMHGGGTTSGIKTCEPDGAGGEDTYNNVTIEDNILYDIRNHFVIRLALVGSNILVRNNLLAGNLRTASQCAEGTANAGWNADHRFNYETALTVESLGAGVLDASGVSVYNNILIGILDVGAGGHTDHNLVWFRDEGEPGTSSIEYSPDFGGCDSIIPSAFRVDGDVFITAPTLPYVNEVFNWALAPGSDAIDLGDPATEYPYTIGTLDSNNEFILYNQRLRKHHNAGPF